MSLPDIIKPTSGRKIQGEGGCMDVNIHCSKHTQICITQTLLCDVVGRALLLYRPNQVAEKVAARISENFSEAAIVMVKSIYTQYMLMMFSSEIKLYRHAN